MTQISCNEYIHNIILNAPYNVKNYLSDIPPIQLDQIELFELDNNVTFPHDFKWYITNVSSCIYVDKYSRINTICGLFKQILLIPFLF